MVCKKAYQSIYFYVFISMGKLEEILNRLMGWWWEPRGRKKTLHITIYDCDLNVYLDWWFMNEDKKSFRELVSKESWLWQFVCENGMVKMKEWYYWQNIALIHSEEYDYCDYQYWVIESSLKDESELEDFLLSNIKV